MSASAAGGRLAAALAYRARGWSVIPIEPRGKRPLVPWRRFQSGLASTDTIRHWFEHAPDANLAIVTGRLSGIVVLDVDPRHGGADSLADVEHAAGPLPATVEATTGGGGRHLYFRHPGPVTSNRVGLRPGLDLRGDGGCVVAPPSIHHSGKHYVWVSGRSPEVLPLADAPAWLVAAGEGSHPHGHRAH
jgi:hypothetical protein